MCSWLNGYWNEKKAKRKVKGMSFSARKKAVLTNSVQAFLGDSMNYFQSARTNGSFKTVGVGKRV